MLVDILETQNGAFRAVQNRLQIVLLRRHTVSKGQLLTVAEDIAAFIDQFILLNERTILAQGINDDNTVETTTTPEAHNDSDGGPIQGVLGAMGQMDIRHDQKPNAGVQTSLRGDAPGSERLDPGYRGEADQAQRSDGQDGPHSI